MTTNESNQPDSTHKLAGSEDAPFESRTEMVIDDTLKSKQGASPQQDSQRKAVASSRGAQLPQNIINELSTVLNKTGRCPKGND